MCPLAHTSALRDDMPQWSCLPQLRFPRDILDYNLKDSVFLDLSQDCLVTHSVCTSPYWKEFYWAVSLFCFLSHNLLNFMTWDLTPFLIWLLLVNFWLFICVLFITFPQPETNNFLTFYMIVEKQYGNILNVYPHRFCHRQELLIILVYGLSDCLNVHIWDRFLKLFLVLFFNYSLYLILFYISFTCTT